MKKNTIIGLSSVMILAVMTGGAKLGSAAEVGENTAEYSSKGQIIFTPNTEPTKPVNPTNPVDPITPVDPIDPEKPVKPGTSGPLSIDFASSFDFGEQVITSQTKTYYATLQKFMDKDNAEKEGPNFVQVTDNRGTETGWKLTVKQDTQFTSTSGKVLKGAEVVLSSGKVVSNSDSEAPVGSELITLVPEGEETNVMLASNGQGAGTYLQRWGSTTEDAAKAISLEVPGATTKYAEKYSTNFVWTLTDSPSND